MIAKIVVIPVGLTLPNIDIIFENRMTNSDKHASLLFQSINDCKNSGDAIWHNPTLLDTQVIFENRMTNCSEQASILFQ